MTRRVKAEATLASADCEDFRKHEISAGEIDRDEAGSNAGCFCESTRDPSTLPPSRFGRPHRPLTLLFTTSYTRSSTTYDHHTDPARPEVADLNVVGT